MKELTKAELEIMQILWNKEQAFMGEIVDAFPKERRPAYSTIQTVIKVLEKKDIIGHETFGKVNRYFPIIKKEDYRREILYRNLQELFDGSTAQLVSCLADTGKITIDQFNELQIMVNKMK